MERPSTLRVWWLASRPKTLPAAAAPVLMGAALAAADAPLHLVALLATFGAALSIQVGTNLVNDWSDFRKGTDNETRIGPVRVTQAGWVTPRQVLAGSVIAFGFTALCSTYLVVHAGWPLAVVFAVSILSGVLYTAGPYPLGYIGVADLFVLVFFGPVAVGGTYFIQTGTLSLPVLVAGLAPGFLSTSILVVNNIRDVDGDRASGKKTLAVRFGRRFARGEYLVCLLIPVLIPMWLWWQTGGHAGALAASAALAGLSIPLVRVVFSETGGAVLNRALAGTAKVLLVYAVLFSLGWLMTGAG